MKKITTLVLIPIALTGCVGFSSDKAKINNVSEIVSYEVASQIQVGDSLDKLYKLMGDPTSQGIDEHGKPYLRYVMLEQISKATTVQILGFIHASTYNYPTGHEIHVFFEEGRITQIARKRYVSEPGDNSK